MKKTAVECLDEKLQDTMYFVYGYTDGVRKVTIPLEDYMRLKQEALEMEKQQIIDAFNQGYREGWIDSISGDCTNDQDVETFEDANLYYTSTYGSKGSDEIKTK